MLAQALHATIGYAAHLLADGKGRLEMGAKLEHQGNSGSNRFGFATNENRPNDFADDPAPGNLRADYVLPSRNLRVTGAGVFWPVPGEPGAELTGEHPFPNSDHRPVWVDVAPGGRR